MKALFGTRPLPFDLHLQGLIFTTWFVLFFVQARLIAGHRVDGIVVQAFSGRCGLFYLPLQLFC
ncbi:MAG TPA: hypothetical protein VGS59_09915 [Candidatus Acidoferrales bacterium]|nr:hypothetical protein [Candidatus Acidoferrales bacterium]